MTRSVKWWDDLREKTFDKWADKYNVTLADQEGLDYYFDDRGNKLFYGMPHPRGGSIFDRMAAQRKHRDQSKIDRPIKYFLLYALPEFIENVVEFPINIYIDTKYFFRYRLFDKYHVIKLDLEPGYYDADFIMNQAIWKIVVDFVEIEAAWMSCVFDDEKKKKFKKDRYFGTLRSRELGEEYFKWHIEEADNHPDTIAGKKAIYDAYLWYKDQMPILNDQLTKLRDDFNWDNSTEDERSKYVRQLTVIEKQIADQNTKHLVQIVSNKDVLWT